MQFRVQKLLSVITYDGNNMSGSNKDVVRRIKKNMLEKDYAHFMNFHCILHQSCVVHFLPGKKL